MPDTSSVAYTRDTVQSPHDTRSRRTYACTDLAALNFIETICAFSDGVAVRLLICVVINSLRAGLPPGDTSRDHKYYLGMSTDGLTRKTAHSCMHEPDRTSPTR